MSEHPSSSPFINSANSKMYGKMPLQSWVGKVVSYDAQKDQIEDGWGWRYKVRILGDNSDVDRVKDDGLSYAICLLPTTAGSGGAYKLRSVRISQGDMVYGIYGADGPRMILGVFPRTRKSTASSGVFGTLSGFTGSLEDTGILDGEYNEQIGPATPGATALDPKEWTKATAKNPSEKVKEIVPQVKKKENGEFEVISEDDTEKNDIKEKVGKVNDAWKPGDNLNTATMEYLKESFDKGELPPETWEAALKQASEQGIVGYEEYVVKDIVKEEVKPKILDSKQKLEAALTKGNYDDYERSVLNVGNTTVRDDGTVVPPFNLARTLNYRRELIRERDSLISSIEFDKRNIGKIVVNDTELVTQEDINASERRLEELNNEISSIEERGTIFSD